MGLSSPCTDVCVVRLKCDRKVKGYVVAVQVPTQCPLVLLIEVGLRRGKAVGSVEVKSDSKWTVLSVQLEREFELDFVVNTRWAAH